MARGAHIALAAVLGCGSPGAPGAAAPGAAAPPTAGERLLAMLPQGAQLVAEIDLARLRANPVVGAVVTRALADDAPAPAVGPVRIDASLATADQVVLAAYGVGTAQAATLTVLAAHGEVAGATRIADGVYAVGPPEWVEQIQQRVALAATGEAAFAIRPAAELLELRGRAMPDGAPGAALRVTARLSFDARIALARLTGIDTAPAQLSAWGDVVDDLAIVVDCDAADPGGASATPSGSASGGRRADPTRRLAATLRGMLAAVAEQPPVRALGLPSSLAGARLTARGTWVRTVIAIGPAHLRRIVERAAALLAAPTSPGDPPS